jgi:putative transposase
MFARLYEHPNKLSLRSAYRYSALAWQKDQGAEPPTYDQVHHYYERYADRRAVLIAREGEEFARNRLVGFISRDAPRPDECWFSDHHIFDAPVRVWDSDRGCWLPCRPWLTAWMDWGSLYFHGVIIRACAPNRDSIERALRDGIEKNGRRPPIHLYIDNGKDYRSALQKTRMLDDGDVQRVQSVGALLGCQTHFAIPYNARAKVIERMFGVVCGQFSKLWAGYRGGNPAERPETADAQWKHPDGLPTLEQFVSAFQQWLAVVYHHNPSEGQILKGRSPSAVREHARPLRDPLEASEIYRAFLREVPGERSIQTGGTVRALNRWYESEALWRLVGSNQKVRVKVDPDNVAVAHIYTLDNREICQAAQVQRLPGLVTADTPAETVEQVREGNARQRRRLRELKAISAENRSLGRFRLAGASGAGQVFDLPVAESATPRRLPAASRPEPEAEAVLAAVSAADVQDFDALLRADTAERLAAERAIDV